MARIKSDITELPEAVQQEVRETLTCFVGCTVTRKNGGYTVVAASCLDTSPKPADFKVWHFKNTDVLTANEIQQGIRELNEAMLK